jgi:predicted PurR-regulated permease PerM
MDRARSPLPGGTPLRPFLHRVLVVVAVALLGVVAWRVREVLLLAFAAVLLATVLRAISDFIVRRTGLPDGAGFACALVIALVLGAAGPWFFGAQAVKQVNELAAAVPKAVATARQWMDAQPWLHSLLAAFPTQGDAGTKVALRLGSVALTGFDALAGLAMVLFGAVYFGAQPGLYRKGITLLFPPDEHERVREALDLTAYAMRRWVLGQLVDMVTVGVLTGIGLWAIGAPSALALGLLTGLFSFVPYIGAIAAGVLAVLIAAAQSYELGLWTLGVYVAVNQLEGHLIMPFVHRWTVSLPPALGIFAVVAMGYLLGPLGLLLATPLTVVVFVLLKKLYLQDMLGEKVGIEQRAKG